MKSGDAVCWVPDPHVRKEAVAAQLQIHIMSRQEVLAITSTADEMEHLIAFFHAHQKEWGADNWNVHSWISEWSVRATFRHDVAVKDRTSKFGPEIILYNNVIPGEKDEYDMGTESGLFTRKVFSDYRPDYLLELKSFGPHVHVMDTGDAKEKLYRIAVALLERREVANLPLVKYRLRYLCYGFTNDIMPHCNSFELFFQACMIAGYKQRLSYDDISDVEFPDIVYQHDGDPHPRPWACRVLHVNDRTWLTTEEEEAVALH